MVEVDPPGQRAHFFGTRVALVSAATSKIRKAIPIGATISKNRKAVRTGYIMAGRNIAES